MESNNYRTTRTRFTHIQMVSTNSRPITPTSRAEAVWESVAVAGRKSVLVLGSSNTISKDWLGTTYLAGWDILVGWR